MLPPSQHIASLGSDHNLHHILSDTSALPNQTVVGYYLEIDITVVVLCNQDRGVSLEQGRGVSLRSA